MADQRIFPLATSDLVESLAWGWNQHLQQLAELRDSWRAWSDHLGNEGNTKQADAVAGCANELDALIGKFRAERKAAT